MTVITCFVTKVINFAIENTDTVTTNNFLVGKNHQHLPNLPNYFFTAVGVTQHLTNKNC